MFKLLTQTLVRKVQGEYRSRRFVVGLTLVGLAGLTLVLALVPSLILVQGRAEAAKVALQGAEKTSISSERDALESWAAIVRRDLALSAPAERPDQPYELFEKALDERPSGIKINGLRWQKDDKSGLGLKVSGIAKDRQTLLLFQNNLKNSGGWSRVEFPVDNLAKETGIEFELSLSPQVQ